MNFSADSNVSDYKQILERCLISFVVRSPTLSYTRSIIAACIVNFVFAIAGTILNSLVLYIFWKSTKLRSKLCYFVIILLSSADLAVVTIVHFLFLLQAINEINGTPNCMYKNIYLFSLYFLPGISVSTLIILNLERYTAIIHPIWHLKTATKRRLTYIWAILWLLNIIDVLSLVFLRVLADILILTVITTLCCTSLVTYVSIFRVARKKKDALEACNTVGYDTNCGYHQGNKDSGSTVAFLRELKIAKTYFIIIVLAFVCCLPPGLVNHSLKYPWNKNENERTAATVVFTWSNTLISLNSTLNCLVFFWANKMLRREALRLFKTFASTRNST